MGAAEMHVKDPGGAIHEREARRIAADAMGLAVDDIALLAQTEGFRIFQQTNATPGKVRAVDWQGTVRLRRHSASVHVTTAGRAGALLSELWAGAFHDDGAAAATPEFLMVHGRHIADFSGVTSPHQATALIDAELADSSADAPVIFVRIVTQ